MWRRQDRSTSLTRRRVRLSGGRELHVCGSGAFTLYRHDGDTTPAWQRSPFAGCWILASPSFAAEIAQAEIIQPARSRAAKLRMAKASIRSRPS